MSADAGAIAGKDFHVEIDEAAQGADIFVVYIHLIDAEKAVFMFFVVHIRFW
jgi:hypothetical protein